MGDLVDLFGRKMKKQPAKQEILLKTFNEELYDIIKKYVKRDLKPSLILITLARQTGYFMTRFKEKYSWHDKALDVLEQAFDEGENK